MTSSGTPSPNSLPFDPYVTRSHVRLTTVYATPWHPEERQLDRVARPAGEFLKLGRLAHFYEVSQRQLPRVIARESLAPAAVTFDRWKGQARDVRVWFFALSSGYVLPALSLDVDTTLIGTIPLLEDLYYAAAQIGGVPFETWSALSIADHFDGEPFAPALQPELHQTVFVGASNPDAMPDEDTMQRLIYRADLPARAENSAIIYPPELNRRPATRGALGPYVSVIAGTQDYVENTILLSAVQGVGSLSTLRQIRQRAYGCLQTLKDSGDHQDRRDVRLMLEEVADNAADLEVELSFGVEAASDLGMLVPSLRVESYHHALFESMRIEHSSTTTGRMLERLRNAIGTELAKVQSIEQRAEDSRRVRTVVAVTFVTTIAGTFSLLFGYFGVNASQVNPNRSMFDHRYLGIYLTIVLIIVAAVVIFGVMTWAERRQAARDRDRQHHWLPRQRANPPIIHNQPGEGVRTWD
jgi:hypothetical protein